MGDIYPDLLHNRNSPGAYLRTPRPCGEDLVPIAIFCAEQPFSHLGTGRIGRADEENLLSFPSFPPAAGGFLLLRPTAGPIIPAAAAFRVHVLSPQGCPDHCPGTAHAALHFDCLYRAVQGAGTALHA